MFNILLTCFLEKVSNLNRKCSALQRAQWHRYHLGLFNKQFLGKKNLWFLKSDLGKCLKSRVFQDNSVLNVSLRAQ